MESAIPIRSLLHGELAELHATLIEFGAFVSDMLASAMRALSEQDTALAEEVKRRDDVADDLDRRIEDIGLRLLTLQHPMARDLYAVTGAIRIAADLERIGDYANDIGKVARRLSGEPLHWRLVDLGRMAEQAQAMLRLALEAVVEHDLDKAREVSRMDSAVDSLWKLVREQCMDHMRVSPEYVEQATFLLLVARYLERIGDHTVNVAERVHFMETGRIEKLR